MLDSNEYEIIIPSWADVVNPGRNLGISSPNIDSKNGNNIFTENSEVTNESKDLIFKATGNGSNKENNIETITEYDESKWIDENSTGMANRVQNIKYNIDNSVGLEKSKIEFGHKTTHANNYIPLTTKRKQVGTKNIYYAYLAMVLATSIFLLTALKTSAFANIMKKVDDKIPPLINEKILQNLGMIEGKKQLQRLFLEKYKKFQYLGNMKVELFPKIIKNDYNIGIDSTITFKEFKVYHFDDYFNFVSRRLEDTKTGELFEQIAPRSGLASDMLETRQLQSSLLKILGREGETVNDVVQRVGIFVGIYESNDIYKGGKKIGKHIPNDSGTEGMRISDIFEAKEALWENTLSQYNWSARKYISRQLMLIINELDKSGIINRDLTITDIKFNSFGEIRLELVKFDIYNKNDEGHSIDFEDKFKDEIVCVGNILQKVLFKNNEETISDEELLRWEELQSKCVKAKELKTYSINDIMKEFSDILGPLDN